jgi:hypothetical protein
MKSKKGQKPIDEQFLHAGKLVHRQMEQQNVSINALARTINRRAATVSKLLRTPNLRVGLLLEVSRALNYNFFRHIANLLPPDMPPAAPPDSAPLEQKIAALEQEIAVLNGVIAWMKSDKEE